MEYKAEDFISFIENNRRDKVSHNGLELIAKRFRELECEVNKLSLGAVSGSGLSKVKKGTGWYMLVSTILSGGVMFCIGQMFGTDGAIIAGILLLIAMASAVRYNV